MNVVTGSTMTGVTDAMVYVFFKSVTICSFAAAVIEPAVGTIEMYVRPYTAIALSSPPQTCTDLVFEYTFGMIAL